MNVDILKVGSLQANCYIVHKDGKCLIIDPGADENFIVSRIRRMELVPVAILITHHHSDHDKVAKPLSSIYNIPIYDFHNLFEQAHFIDPFRFKVIYTPGHTDDSITLYFHEYDIMFTGDFLFHENVGRTDFPTGDYKQMVESINKIKEYDDKIQIFPGHDEKTTLGHEKEYNKYFE